MAPTDLGAEVVHDVAKLVEVGLDLPVVQQGRLLRRVLGEVAEHGRHRLLLLPVRTQATLPGSQRLIIYSIGFRSVVLDYYSAVF